MIPLIPLEETLCFLSCLYIYIYHFTPSHSQSYSSYTNLLLYHHFLASNNSSCISDVLANYSLLYIT